MPNILTTTSTTSTESTDFFTIALIFWICIFAYMITKFSNRMKVDKINPQEMPRNIKNIGFDDKSSEVTMTVGSGDDEIEINIKVTKKKR